MIIFEGTDCSGKTTLAQRVASILAARNGLHQFKRYGFLPNEWDYSTNYMADIQASTVLDRFTTSEIVYGTLFRGGPNPKFTSLNQAVIARELQWLCAVTVHMSPPVEVIVERLSKRGDPSFNKDQIVAAHKLFDDVIGNEFFSRYDNTVLRKMIDFPKEELDAVAESIIATQHAVVDEYEQLFLAVGQQDDYDGHGPYKVGCEAIVIGEQGNKKIDAKGLRNRALCCGQSAEYIHTLLTAVGINPSACHMVNAYQRNDGPLSKDLLMTLTVGQAPVIALGNKASSLLDKYNIRHIRADHPAYLQRFFYAAFPGVVAWLKGELSKWPSGK